MSAQIARGFHIEAQDMQFLSAHHPVVFEYLPPNVMQSTSSPRLADLTAARMPPPRVAGMVVEPVFYFPAWSCGVPEPRTQLLMHRPECTPRLQWTLPERIGAAISGLFALVLFTAAFRPSRRKLFAG
jgi:hypothetical protein